MSDIMHRLLLGISDPKKQKIPNFANLYSPVNLQLLCIIGVYVKISNLVQFSV